MTTQLSQKRVKGGDPSFANLQEEMQARSIGSGGGYVPPAGGIPKSDLSTHLQTLLTDVENSLLIKTIGVTIDDLEFDLEQKILTIDDKYVKPIDGIPIADLEQTIQNRLNQFADYYVYPAGGIPRVDFDNNVQFLLTKAENAYQKPAQGIPREDLNKDITDTLALIPTKYMKPVGGIPDTDLAERYVKESAMTPIREHMDNKDIHITDHEKLQNIGVYTHPIIDEKLDSNGLNIQNILHELEVARADFSSVGNRLDSLLGLNSFYSVRTELEWNKGMFTDLYLNSLGSVGLKYQSDRPVMDLYDIATDDFFKPENKIGQLYFETDSRVFLGKKPWQTTTGRNNNVGVRLVTNVYADVSGIYEFATQFSGRMRLQVGSTLLYDTQTVFGQIDAYTRTGQVELEAGRLYRLVFEGWYLNEGDRVVGLTWKRPGMNTHREIEPQFFNSTGYMTRTGQYVSELIDMNDNNISKWVFELDASENRYKDDIIVEIQRSIDNKTYTPWEVIEENSEILLTPTRYCRVRITLNQNYESYSPIIHGFLIRYISSKNDEMMNELILARDSFITINDRLKAIEKQILNLAEFDALNDQNSIHPEYFASVRLADQEMNTLQMMVLEAERQLDYIVFNNAMADVFKTNNGIDDALSDKYENVNGSVRTLSNVLRLETNQEWAQWNLDKMDFVDGDLRLATTTSGGLSSTTAFSNWNLWSTRDTARLAGNFQAYIAQPFYTSKNVNILTRLQLQAYDTSYQPQSTIMICNTREDADAPNLINPIWSQFLGYTTTINLTNLRIPIKGEQKYWIVLKRETLQNQSGYTRWYLANNVAATSIRLRGTNPENANLFVRYTADASGQNGWITDTNFFLSFHIDESLAFESYGTASKIIDYQKETHFELADVTHDLSVDGLLTMTYQTSQDGHLWSDEKDSLKDMFTERFLKINISMQKSSTGLGSPVIKRIDILSKNGFTGIVTKPIELLSIPTHAMYYAQHDKGVHLEISRDDGRTWKRFEEKVMTPLDDTQPGTTVRVKAVFDSRYPLAWLHALAFSATTYKDITQQNVTALYEEYIASIDQQVFQLRDPFVMGNNSLQVYLNGIRQSVLKDYTEVDNRTVMFNEPLLGGIDADRVTFVVAAGAYDQHDAHMKAEIDYVKERVDHMNESHSKTHTYSDTGLLMKTTFSHGYYILRIDYEYDSNKRKIKETKVTKTYTEIIEYNYDVQGNLVNEIITVNEVTN